jgi:hypothetical protein
MATLNLGRIKPVFKGAYDNTTAYVVDDIVTFGDESFICIQASTGNATSNTSYWTKMAAKGTDGTDLGTTLTTQGDIVYRDASGLARLGAGTSGQVLQTNGTGANPSWGTVSSDYVLISTNTLSSATANIDFKTTAQSGELDFSTYNRYRIELFYVTHNASTDYSNLYMRFLNSSGSVLQDTNYMYSNDATMTGVASGQGDSVGNAIKITRDYIGKQSGRSAHVYIDLPDLTNTSYWKHVLVHCHGANHDATSKAALQMVSGFHTTTDAKSGIRLYLSDGSFASGIKYKVYGIK